MNGGDRLTMRARFGKVQKIFNPRTLSREALLYRVGPHLLMDMMGKYFRIEIEGLENLPKDGSGLIIPNHSGYAGFDAAMLLHEVHKGCGRTAKVLTHHLWFVTQITAAPMKKLGFIDATTANGIKYLTRNDLVILFPEGEYGNFKASSKAYLLQNFKRGFVRMALQTQSPIIPTVVIGAEETHINLKQLNLTKYFPGIVLPLPLNVLPLPAKWKIIFLEPIHLPYKSESANDSELVHEVAQDIRERIQKTINKELKSRKAAFLSN